MATCREAMRTDPFLLYPVLNLCSILTTLGRGEEALALVEKTFQIEPDAPLSFLQKAITLIYLGRLQESAGLIERLEKSFEEKKIGPVLFQIVKHAYFIQENNPDSIEANLEEIRKTADNMPTSGFELGNYAIFLSPLLIRHGHKELAYYILEKCEDLATWVDDGFRLCPDFQKLEGEPRFEKILTRSRARLEEALTVFEEARRRGEFPKYLEKPLEELLIKLNIKMPQTKG
jgi:tetratricopeptide (TPR) repeat protein